jgi:hypothetical protein
MSNKYHIFLDNKEQPDFENYILFGEDKEIDILPNFNTINILVGSNNSGKSRFMRTLMKQQKINGFYSFSNFLNKVKEYNIILLELNINWVKSPSIYPSAPTEAMRRNDNFIIEPITILPKEFFISFDNNILNTHLNKFTDIRAIDKYYISQFYIKSNTRTSLEFIEDFDNLIQKAMKLNLEITEKIIFKEMGNSENYFIPTLRTAHSLFENTSPVSKVYKKHQKDIFLETVLKNYELEDFIENEKYNPDSKLNKKIFVFTGLQLYNEIVNARNGTKEERKRFDDFEKFIGKQFFNAPIDIVAKFNYNEKHENKDDKETINIHIGESSRNLHDLGDGIQALIILASVGNLVYM